MMKVHISNTIAAPTAWAILVAASVCFAPAASAAQATSRPTQNRKGVIVTLKGEINDVALRSLKVRFKQAEEEYSPDVIILQIDTFGGLLKSALNIAHMLRDQEPRVVAYVKPRAISAGALIALACNEIVMREGSRIGDCAPIAMGAKLEGVEREKAESPTRAEFRASAQRNGYNLLLAMSMVSDYMVVHKIHRKDDPQKVQFVDNRDLRRLTGARVDKETGEVLDPAEHDVDRPSSRPAEKQYDWVFERTVVRRGELLTMTDEEAVELGFAKTIVGGQQDLARFYHLRTPLTVLNENWSQRLAAFLGSMEVRGILMILMIVCIYIEVNTPGIGVPGALAAVCLMLMLGAPYLTGLANVWEILLILVGVALLLIEIFVIPGFGVAGISGIMLILLGLLLTFVQEPIDPRPFAWPSWGMFREGVKNGLTALLIGLVGACVLCVVIAKYFHRIPVLRNLPLEGGLSVLTPREQMVGAFGGPALGGSIHLEIGSEGTTESVLRPAGKARFGRELVDVVAEGQFIEVRQPVEVVQIQGNRVVVKPKRT